MRIFNIIFNIIKYLTSFNVCDEIHSEFMIKKLPVPVSILLPGRVCYISPHISHFALNAGSWGDTLHPEFATMFLYFYLRG